MRYRLTIEGISIFLFDSKTVFGTQIYNLIGIILLQRKRIVLIFKGKFQTFSKAHGQQFYNNPR